MEHYRGLATASIAGPLKSNQGISTFRFFVWIYIAPYRGLILSIIRKKHRAIEDQTIAATLYAPHYYPKLTIEQIEMLTGPRQS